MSEIEHQGTVAMPPASARNSQEDFFRGLAAHYMDALTQIIVTDDLNECHRLAGIFLGSNPPPVHHVRGWKLVPIEPTLDMVMAGEAAHDRQLDARLDANPRKDYPSEETVELCCRVAYRAMINAAPTPEKMEDDHG